MSERKKKWHSTETKQGNKVGVKSGRKKKNKRLSKMLKDFRCYYFSRFLFLFHCFRKCYNFQLTIFSNAVHAFRMYFIYFYLVVKQSQTREKKNYT